MGTRSVIALASADGVKAIYCHWDGHIETNGAILQEHWNCRDYVERLIELGDISSLGEDLDDTEAYCRDRNEPSEQTAARTYAEYHEMLKEEFEDSDREFVYIFMRNDKWSVIDYRTAESKGVHLLTDALAEINRAEIHAV